MSMKPSSWRLRAVCGPLFGALMAVSACGGENESARLGQPDGSSLPDGLDRTDAGDDSVSPPDDTAAPDVSGDAASPDDAVSPPDDTVTPDGSADDTGPEDTVSPPDDTVTADTAVDDGFVADTGPTDVSPSDTAPPTDTAPPSDSGANDTTTADIAPDVVIDTCGNNFVDDGEDCDDGNDDDQDGCRNDCTKAVCGDGVVWLGVETCDTAIGPGAAGACPNTCTSNDTCAPRLLVGSGCSARCETTPVVACADNDGCCLASCDSNRDNDCEPDCGNGVIEDGELCDGNCPTTCGDDNACTTNQLVGSAATCDAVCLTGSINRCGSGDGCCPANCNANNDGDCSATCNNGTLEPGETCDPRSSCPSRCDDGDACTSDLLTGSATTCNATCTSTPITACVADDGCCAPGCNSNNDADCEPDCGNGIRERGEDCDGADVPDGFTCTDACVAVQAPTTFRFSDLDIRDPHIFIDMRAFGFGCYDMTDNAAPFNLAPSFNTQLQTAVQTDADDPPNGLLDLSLLTIFNPLRTDSRTALPLGFAEGLCTAPLDATACELDGVTPIWTSYNVNSGGATTTDRAACLGPITGTTHGYTPGITSATAGANQFCFATTTGITIQLDFSGVVLPLQAARLGGTFTGANTGIANGLVMGFLSEADADRVTLPATLPLVGGKPFSSLLPGGKGSCANHDGRDTGPDGTTVGWWLYLNFSASRAPLSDFP